MSSLTQRTQGQQQELIQLIQERRTIHKFLPEPAPPEALQRAIEAACWAPNHRDTEPWRFYSLGPRSAQAVAERNAELVTAIKGEAAGQAKRERWAQMPGWLVVTSLRATDTLVERENYAATCCAVQNLGLVLWAAGIGLKWGTGPVTRDVQLAAIVGFDPEQEDVVGLFWYGYPEVVPRKTRQQLDVVLREVE